MKLRALAAGLVAIALATACRKPPPAKPTPPPPPEAPTRVKVAAIQFHSVMGDPKRNRAGLAALVRRAAADGAKIVVLPEAAISGYADIDQDLYWTSVDPPEPGRLPASAIAETVDGESVRLFKGIARECAIYVTIPFVEKAGGKYYNSAVLAGPDGTVRIHYRKQHLWTAADPSWVTPGDLGTPVIETEYGRLGVMICYDVNFLLPEFGEKSADIVLHCVAWFGPWFDNRFNKKVKDAGVTLVLANWTFPTAREWRGAGATRIIGPDGAEIARIDHDIGDGIVTAELPVKRRAAK